MWSVLRTIGLMNAAVWLGGCVFFTFAAAPALFQPEMKRLLQDYHTGLVAQLMQERYYSFQVVCGAVALAHTLLEWLVGRRSRSSFVPGLLALLYAIILSGTFWLLPHMKALHTAKYTAPTTPQREQAAASFRAWHGLAQGLNLFMLGGLAVYLWRLGAATPNTLPLVEVSYSPSWSRRNLPPRT
jgi:hypothetical protein